MDSTKFYSTKLQENVFIPKDRTCGYRIRNDYMPRGYSSGLKAGRNNGVVNQRLSKFTTDHESEQAKSKCDGNTNWYNHKRGTNFISTPRVDKGKTFQIKRPGFKKQYEPDFKKPSYAEKIDDINQRRGNVYGNHEIRRPGSLAEAPLPRMTVDFNKLQALDLQNFGAKVQLSDKTIKQIFNIEVPDPLDKNWLDEKNRIVTNLKAKGFSDQDILNHLEANKPLGRSQRTISKKGNIGNSILSLSNKLSELLEELRQGRGSSQTQRATLIAQLALSLDDTQEITRLSKEGNEKLVDVLNGLKIPSDPKIIGLNKRFIGKSDYESSKKGLINTHILNKASEEGSNIIEPVFDNLGRSISLEELEIKLAQGGVLDLANNTVLDRDDMEHEIEEKQGLIKPEISESLASQLEQSEQQIREAIQSGSRQGQSSLTQLLSQGRKGLTEKDVKRLKKIGKVTIDPLIDTSDEFFDNLIEELKEESKEAGSLAEQLARSRTKVPTMIHNQPKSEIAIITSKVPSVQQPPKVRIGRISKQPIDVGRLPENKTRRLAFEVNEAKKISNNTGKAIEKLTLKELDANGLTMLTLKKRAGYEKILKDFGLSGIQNISGQPLEISGVAETTATMTKRAKKVTKKHKPSKR